jgi:SNF2 family DNA or RNA helicase
MTTKKKTRGPSTKVKNRQLVDTLKKWTVIEETSVKQTSEIIKKTPNKALKTLFEIIKQDSAMHRKVQQLIIDSIEKTPFVITPEDTADIWDLVEDHIKLEQKTIELAVKARKSCSSPVARFFLRYLLTDEEKHDALLENLSDIKAGLYPYG